MYKNCPLLVHDREFSVDLIALHFHEFDLMLGMDWLSKHRAIINCDKKIVLLKCSTKCAETLIREYRSTKCVEARSESAVALIKE